MAEEAVNYLGVTNSTARAYLASNLIPSADRRYGVTNLRKPETIRKWNASWAGESNSR